MNIHTPWKQGEDEFSIFVTNSIGQIVCDVRHLAIYGTQEDQMEAHRGVARIVAAAPSMLQMLKDVAAYLKDANVDPAYYLNIKQVIEAAEGNST